MNGKEFLFGLTDRLGKDYIDIANAIHKASTEGVLCAGDLMDLGDIEEVIRNGYIN